MFRYYYELIIFEKTTIKWEKTLTHKEISILKLITFSQDRFLQGEEKISSITTETLMQGSHLQTSKLSFYVGSALAGMCRTLIGMPFLFSNKLRISD